MCSVVADTVVADVMSSTFSKPRCEFRFITNIKIYVRVHLLWFADMCGPLGRFNIVVDKSKAHCGHAVSGGDLTSDESDWAACYM